MGLIEKRLGELTYMISPNISVSHAFTTRYGGHSKGIYESLNFAFRGGDDYDTVRSNYEVICKMLGISVDDLVRVNQVHGCSVRVVDNNNRGRLYDYGTPEGDAMITNERGLALIVYAADCVPILLYDVEKRVVGAIHAGWRGTAADVAGATVRKMSEEYACSPMNITAAIGPSISRCCFETGADVAEALGFIKEHCQREHKDEGVSAQDSFVVYKNRKFFIDLKEANRLLLTAAGVRDIVVSDECTYCSYQKYWSHRKTKGIRGTQAAIIVIK